MSRDAPTPSPSSARGAAPSTAAEGRRTRVVELSAALTAVVVSFGSLLIARHQAQVMDRQLAATVWPLVEFGTSNMGDDGKVRASLDLGNSGVGPTRIRSLRLTYKGRPVRGPAELLRACCRAAIDTSRTVATTTSDITGRVLPAGRTVAFLIIPPDTLQRALYGTFNRERFAVKARVCYCSVLDECWVMDSTERDADPRRVDSCAAEQKAPQYR